MKKPQFTHKEKVWLLNVPFVFMFLFAGLMTSGVLGKAPLWFFLTLVIGVTVWAVIASYVRKQLNMQ